MFSSLENKQFIYNNRVEDITSHVNKSLGLDVIPVFDESSNFNGISSQIFADSDMESEQTISKSCDTLVTCNESNLEKIIKLSCNGKFKMTAEVNFNQRNVIETSSEFCDFSNHEHTTVNQQGSESKDNLGCFLNNISRDDFSEENKHFLEEIDYNYYLEPINDSLDSLTKHNLNENYAVSMVDMVGNNSEIITKSAEIFPTKENDLNEFLLLNKREITNQSVLKRVQQHATCKEVKMLQDTSILQEVNCTTEFIRSDSVVVPELINIKNLDTENISRTSYLSTPQEIDLCPSKYLEDNDLNSDKVRFCPKSKLNSGIKRQICPHCFKSFRFPSKLKRHIRIHNKHSDISGGDNGNKNAVSSIEINTTVSMTKNPICFNLEASDLSQNKHGHKKDLLQCSYCPKTFRFPSKLKQHTKTHIGSKSYSCHLCSKAYLGKHNLKAHIKIHGNEQSHICDICKRAFTFKSNFTRHMKFHVKERTFICSECGDAYSSDKALKFHFRIHDKSSHKCTLCGKSFKKKSNLKRHAEIHSNERPYPCSLCDYSARQDFHLKRHMKRHHEN